MRPITVRTPICRDSLPEYVTSDDRLSTHATANQDICVDTEMSDFYNVNAHDSSEVLW
jgi:hypothetical protein